ncbi:uncharacterized protein MAM_02826 [Metarhizium album ARSEF 1941]|uniref:Altered inheritance of mitochondria protein 21 n=1 Tax=Metarhizium album (strain ARSEF 1941) TaxID=1081103 RepID=A0A0B2WYK6_METAS|nr:uncharacterized protein MAM_02826 [Metarhizium album ARSEF 1941]KHN99128.1 hypothetical protein MAM_02826 [Metarhizium album ARSEF 1941]
MAQTPVVPPRPSRSSGKEAPTHLMPPVPPRPVNKRLDRPISPGGHRFAQSPLTAGIPSVPVDDRFGKHYAQKEHAQDPVERANSVDMPSVGEEGMEYSAVAAELQEEETRPHPPEQTRPHPPEQTRSVAEGLHLHAPKPSLPAQSAKKQVMAVTRTDSDKAASFGIGQPSNSEDRAVSRGSTRKRPESSISAYSDLGNHTDDEHGIPEIGQRVPMNKHLGDVQAPSPGPENSKKHHSRRLSGRGLPPGSYGLHGHGVVPQDKLEQAYYQKHPEALEREQHTPRHERHNDFAMSSSDLNRLVRDTANHHAKTALAELRGTPTDDCAFEASEKYASRMSSSRPTSAVLGEGRESSSSSQHATAAEDNAIHVDDGKNPEFYSYGGGKVDEEAEDYTAPILASDELKKDPSRRVHQPAIRPHLERHGSSLDGEDPPSRPPSRPRVQRYQSQQQEVKHTPLEDVEEYDPLFPEDAKGETATDKQELADENCDRRHFPSKDIWEDAPNSVHYTTEVSTPDVTGPERRRSSAQLGDRPITPAQAFAQYQEELAEKEANQRGNNFLPLQDPRPSWVSHQPHLHTEARPSSGLSRRFPSRDIWEDAPDSHIHEAEVSASPVEQTKPDIPAETAKEAEISPERPVVPERPKGRQNSADDAVKARPPVSDKPKPSVPPRANKSSPGESKDGTASKPKPPVPSRPAGSKIALLQTGFMSDLNKRLQLGPQGVKKGEPKEEEAVDDKEKVPLSDARKGRARGPQRRAPAKSTTAETSSEMKPAAPVLSFSTTQTVWSIDPEHGECSFGGEEGGPIKEDTKSEALSPVLKPAETSTVEPDRTKEASEQSEPTQEIADSERISKIEEPEIPNDERSDLEGDVEQRTTEERKRDLTLAANTAGESILEVAVKNDHDQVEPVEVHDDVQS